MALSGIRERAAQSRALIRNEGLGALLKRALLVTKNRIVDSGNVVWIHRDTTPHVSVDGAAAMVITECEPGSAEEMIAERLRPLTSIVREQRLAAGGVRCLIHADNIEDPVYTCWIYTERLPVSEPLGVSIPMPETMAAVEDSFIPRAHRGAHTAAPALDALGVVLYEQGVRTMLGKIDEENEAALGAARISGWNRFGVVHGTVWLNRIPRWRVQLDDPVVASLAELESRPRGF
jgi:hypothetical protein